MKDDRVYLEHILRCIERIESYVHGDPGSFQSSSLIQDAVLRNLQTMAESTQRLSSSAKALRPEVPWPALSGLRNVLVHSYLGIDLDQIERALRKDMPQLRAACQAILADLQSEG